MELVFESLVQSGFLALRAFNQDQDWSSSITRLAKTGLDWYKPVYIGLTVVKTSCNQSKDRSYSSEYT